MKKILSAVALAAICASPLTAMASGTTLYGQLRYSFNSIDEDKGTDATGADIGIDGLSGEDNISLFGLKGSYGDTIKAFFHLQTQAFADSSLNVGSGVNTEAFKQRFFFGGLDGPFGKLAYGRMTNAYKFDGFALDPFYNYSHVSAVGSFNAGGATYGLSAATNGFSDNALQYVSPSLAGLKVQGGVYLDDSNEDNHGYSAGLSYGGVKGLKVGLVYAANEGAVTQAGIDKDGSAYRGYVTYKVNDLVKLGLSVEDVDTTATDDAFYTYLTGSVAVPTIDTEFSASFGMVDDGPAEGWGTTLGAWYNVVTNTKLFALMSYSDITVDERYVNIESGIVDRQPLVISIGAQHKFSLSTK